MTTGEKIYELRKKARITQEEFAERLNVTRQAVSKWESDNAFPETETIVKIASMFDVSCDYLLKDGNFEKNAATAEKQQRAFLSMMFSFSLAVVAVGFVVALVCYYAANRGDLIGLGVLTGFLLAGFILWSVGRYLFLSRCSYREEDKRFLAKRTKMILYVSILAFACYLPAVLFFPWTELRIEASGIALSQVVRRRLGAGEFVLTAFAFGCAGFALAELLNFAHKHALGATFEKMKFADAVFRFVCVAVAAAMLGCAICGAAADLANVVDFPAAETLFFGFGLTAGVILVARAVVSRILEKTPARDFALQLAGGILVLCNLIDPPIILLFSRNDFEIGWRIAVAGSYAFGALLLCVAVAQIVFAAKRPKEERSRTKALHIALPIYLLIGFALLLYFWAPLYGRDPFYLSMVFYTVYALYVLLQMIFAKRTRRGTVAPNKKESPSPDGPSV